MAPEELEVARDEAFELLDEIEAILLEAKKQPPDQKIINRLFRAIHTIKGTCAMFGFDQVAGFAHQVENSMDAVRQGKTPFSDGLAEMLLSAKDHIAQLLEADEAETAALFQKGEEIIGSLTAVTAAAFVMDKPQSCEEKQAGCMPVPIINRQLRTLIVEDEFLSRSLLQTFLAPFGSSHVAVDGYEAVQAFKIALTEGKPYDLICLDVMMPGIDGRLVAAEIKRLKNAANCPSDSRVIMTTGIDDNTMITEMFQEKLCDAYMIKPIDRTRLTDIIRQFFVFSGSN